MTRNKNCANDDDGQRVYQDQVRLIAQLLARPLTRILKRTHAPMLSRTAAPERRSNVPILAASFSRGLLERGRNRQTAEPCAAFFARTREPRRSCSRPNRDNPTDGK
jgi:hypothetical protein